MDELIFFVNRAVISGAVIGSIYAMGAIGITLVFAILRFAHFAHSELMTFGAFATFVMVAAAPGVGPAIGLPTAFVFLPVALALTALFAIGLDRMFYRPLRREGAKPIVFLMASIGVTLMLQALVRLFFGADARSMYVDDRKEIFRLELPAELARQRITITEPQIILLLFVAAAVVALHLFLTRARLGKAMRAMSDNADLARVSGIDVQTVVAATWAIGGGLAAAAGVLLALDVSLKPDLAFHVLLPMFAAAIVGGVGQPYGAVAGGFLVGFAETFAVFNWAVLLRPIEPLFAEFWDLPTKLALVPTEYKITVPFVILIAVLIYRPTGLFRGAVL